MKNNIQKNKKLHIVFLDFDDIKNPLLAGGQAHATQEVGSQLAGKGHKITVIASKYPYYKDRVENGIRYVHIGLGSKNIKVNNFAYILILPFFVRKLSADIIVECFTAPISTLLSPLFTKIPVVALPTSFDAERFSKIYHLPLWLIEKYGTRAYRYFIALTPHLQQKMKKYNPTIVSRIIGQGVSSEYAAIKNKIPQHILFLGRLDMHQKGIDLLLQAYAKVAEKINFPLVIAGDGPDKEKVEDAIHKLNLERKVTLVGFADKKKKMELLEKSAFVAFPSRNEGFSLFSLEAIASGHRLVAYNIPSVSFADTQVARKVKPFSTSSYANALYKEAKEGNWKLKAHICKGFAKKYSWNTVGNEFNAFFQDIVGKERVEK